MFQTIKNYFNPPQCRQDESYNHRREREARDTTHQLYNGNDPVSIAVRLQADAKYNDFLKSEQEEKERSSQLHNLVSQELVSNPKFASLFSRSIDHNGYQSSYDAQDLKTQELQNFIKNLNEKTCAYFPGTQVCVHTDKTTIHLGYQSLD